MNINNHHTHSAAHGRVRAMASSYSNGITSPSQIPMPKFTTSFRFPTDPVPPPQQSPILVEQNGNDHRWKSRFEEAERKRKGLLTDNQKCARDYANLERRFKDLSNDHYTKQRLLQEKSEELNRLRQVSEGLYKEYEKLKNRYDVETNAMHNAMKSASQWYSQNRELKRKSAVLVQKFLEVSPSGILDLADEADSSESKEDDELAGLRHTVKELSGEVARLQTELKAARLQEFEAQEQIMNLQAQLEEELAQRRASEHELRELRLMKDNMGRVSKLVAEEMASLRERCEQEREAALRMRSEANAAQKERNVLAHQSTLLLSEVMGDERLMNVLMEVESLKRQLEEQQQKHSAEIQELQDKLEQSENEAQIEVLEEKLKLAESEVECLQQKAERAESNSSQLNNKVKALEEEIENLKRPPPPPPPPLPPPPPPPPLPGTGTITLRNMSASQVNSGRSSPEERTTGNPVLDMANMLGIPRKTTKTAPQSGAIDDIINQIKGGRFQLKTPERHPCKKEEEPPAAVQEMLSVLGTLKRRQRNSQRQQPSSSANHALADVAL